MSYTSNYVLNERVSYLEWEVNNLNPPPGGYTLSTILAQGNSAGSNDINMNNNDIINADGVSATTLNVAGAINLQNTNNQIYNDSTNNTIITFPVGKSVQIGQTGFSRLAVSATGVQINGIPLSFDSTNNLGIQPSGGYTILTLASKNANGAVQIAVANGSSVVSTPVIVNSATTTISNATTINNLSSTTQTTGTNNNTVATTAFVQNSIQAIPSVPTVMPYFRFSQLTNVNSNRQGTPFGFQFNGSTGWTTQDFFTVRLSVSCITANNATNFNLTCVMDIFPALCPANTAYGSTSGNATTVASSPFVNLNGNIWSGSQYYSTFSVPLDATYNPLGRWFNPTSYQLINNLGTAQQPNCLPIYPYITNTTQQTNFGFQLWALSTVAFQNLFSVNCEIIGNTTTNAITSYGVTQFSNYYKTF